MLFYKFCVEMVEREEKKVEDNRSERRDMARALAMKAADFNGADEDRFCFLAPVGNESICVGVIARERVDFGKLVGRFVKCLEIDAKILEGGEVTLSTIQTLLNNAECVGYIEDSNEIMEKFGIDISYSGEITFGENLINTEFDKDQLADMAGELFMKETLLPELDRIFTKSKYTGIEGHPVHYIVETDDLDVRKKSCQLLLSALSANARLDNIRYSFLDFRPSDMFSQMSYNALYKVSEGGAVIVRCVVGDNGNAGNTAAIETVCEIAKRYRNRVLTVFCFPRECKRIKAEFYENLGDMAFVELREDFINAEAAVEVLKNMAKKKHIRTDKKLFAELASDKKYLTPEITCIFDEWYNKKLRSTVYPQYGEMKVARKETVKSKPQGSAYEELMEMIGLSEAKQVIKKALNYYKMQKLYEERGVKKNDPAMHMAFTGNPGTAKTTVARLFARIMRENGLLSRGQLVEVGRGDLVGKYIGWTAQTVKAKFKEASGGMLFIDEAYSLVDDRDGSFGDEAISTIVQEMENHRADVVVIFAGYPGEMGKFLAKNPGLRSRIAFHVPFSDYNNDELCDITRLIVKNNGMKIEKEAISKLELVFEAARESCDFGNGRFARNIFEQAKMNQATRLLERDFDDISYDDVLTITADDIVVPEVKKTKKNRIGFC